MVAAVPLDSPDQRKYLEIIDRTVALLAEGNAGYVKYVEQKDRAFAILNLSIDTPALYNW